MTASRTMPHVATASIAGESFLQKLNAKWHERALQLFMVIVLAHWARASGAGLADLGDALAAPVANGILGLWYPWLIKSESCTMGTPW